MKFDFKKLKYTIENKKRWLVSYKGLELPPVMDILLDPFKTKLTSEEISTFYKGLELMKLTNYHDVEKKYKYSEILHGNIEKYGMLIRDNNGNYDYLNKLDTSYSEISNFISYLIQCMINDNDPLGEVFYNKIMNETENGLIEFKPLIVEIANKYLKSIDEYREHFVDQTKYFTSKGDYSESLVMNFLLENNFEIKYTGNNGDFIDKIYGVDFIVYHKVYGYKTVQVKLNENDLHQTFDRYQGDGIDWGVVSNKKELSIYDLQNDYNIVNLFNIDSVKTFIEFKHDFIKNGMNIPINKTDKIKPLYLKQCDEIIIDGEYYNVEQTLNQNELQNEYIGFVSDDDFVISKSIDIIVDDKITLKNVIIYDEF